MFGPWNSFFMYNYDLNQDFMLKKSFDCFMEHNKKCYDQFMKFFDLNNSSKNNELKSDLLDLLKQNTVTNIEKFKELCNTNSDFYNDYMNLLQKSVK